MAMGDKKKDELDYGEGQREQYGEGSSYRPEEKTEAADEMGKSGGFAGGDHARDRQAGERGKPVKAK
jgi:hypothetical protein